MSKPVTQRITRKSASNLALAFVLLPRERREAMASLYAFCREIDDVADDQTVHVSDRRRVLAEWREDVRRACNGEEPRLEVTRELRGVIARYRLPFEHFDDVLRGVEMDLDINRYENYDQLDRYCHRVASVVGLLSIEIFGYQNPACRDYAVALGKALQLTNILRDVGSDAGRQRIYLPLDQLARFGVRPEEILDRQYSDRFRDLAASVAQRAQEFYRAARVLLPVADRHSMIAAELMGSVYWQLLRKLETRGFNVLGPHPERLCKATKLYLIARTWYRMVTNQPVANYGTP